MPPSWLQQLTRATVPDAKCANLFGVILYTDRHVHLAKVLADDQYWKALHELSGTRWNVFATRGEPGSRGKGFLRSVWKEPKANLELLEQFELKSTESFPILMVYAEDTNGELHQRAIPIKGNTQEEVFNSLSDSLRTIADTLDGFLDENRRIKTRAFEVLNEHLDAKEQWAKLKKLPGIVFLIKDQIKKYLS